MLVAWWYMMIYDSPTLRYHQSFRHCIYIEFRRTSWVGDGIYVRPAGFNLSVKRLMLGIPYCEFYSSSPKVIRLPTQTMHCYKGNPRKLTYICMVWFLPNGYKFNDPCPLCKRWRLQVVGFHGWGDHLLCGTIAPWRGAQRKSVRATSGRETEIISSKKKSKSILKLEGVLESARKLGSNG